MKDHYCSNCHHPLPEKQPFCGQCGQKAIRTKPRILDLAKELSSQIFNLESKNIKTPFLLFKPGFLTMEFFKGRRQRYTHPSRLLFITLLIYLSTFLFFNKEDIQSTYDTQLLELEHYHNFIYHQEDSLQQFLTEKYPNQEMDGIVDTLGLFAEEHLQDINILSGAHSRVKPKDFLTLTDEEIFEKYEINGFVNQIIYKQFKRIHQSPGDYVNFLFNNISWSILFSIPLLACILTVLYYRNNRYYVEHLVFMMHLGTFIFLIGIFSNILEYYFTNALFYVLPYSIGGIWLFPAMKKYYEQSYPKTLLKYGLFISSSIIILSLMLILTIIAVLILF